MQVYGNSPLRGKFDITYKFPHDWNDLQTYHSDRALIGMPKKSVMPIVCSLTGSLWYPILLWMSGQLTDQSYFISCSFYYSRGSPCQVFHLRHVSLRYLSSEDMTDCKRFSLSSESDAATLVSSGVSCAHMTNKGAIKRVRVARNCTHRHHCHRLQSRSSRVDEYHKLSASQRKGMRSEHHIRAQILFAMSHRMDRYRREWVLALHAPILLALLFPPDGQLKSCLSPRTSQPCQSAVLTRCATLLCAHVRMLA